MALFNAQELKSKASEVTGMYKKASQVLIENARSFSPYSTYDIFLSHSFADAEIILGLQKILTSKNYTVYVDWIEDPQLNRANVTKDTAKYIRARMKMCKSLLYATSNNASTSKWMPWELGFFDGFKTKVAIVPISNTSQGSDDFKGQEYLGIYPYLVNGQTLYIHNSAQDYMNFDRWLKS
jgi:hypothetical protein